MHISQSILRDILCGCFNENINYNPVLSSFLTYHWIWCPLPLTILESAPTDHSGVPSHWPFWSTPHWPFWSLLPPTILEPPPTDHSGASSHWPFWGTLPLTILEPPPTDHSGAPSHWPFWSPLPKFSCVRVAQSLVFCVVSC